MSSQNGFNYFDTAHGYIGGLSELAIKECLTSRYPRERFILTNKLTDNFFHNEEDIDRVFNEQLEVCGVSYFDFYLLHALKRNNYEHYKNCGAFKKAIEFLNQGRIKHMGISFHDTADILDQILTDYPEIEVVQIQYNYLDYDDLELIFAITSMWFMLGFTKDKELIKVVQIILFIDIALEIGRASNLVYGQALKASGDSIYPAIVAVIVNFSAVCLVYLFGNVLKLGVAGAYIGLTLDECIRAIFMFFRYKKGKWEEKVLIKR